MSPASEVTEDIVSTDDSTNQSQSSAEDTSCRTDRSSSVSSMGSDHRESERCFVVQSPAGSSAVSSVVGANLNFSVINYVGKAHKQSSHRTVVRSRTPYERHTIISSQPSRVESIDESTNSSIASSIDGCSTIGDSASVVADATEMADLDDNSRASSDQQVLVQQLRIHHGPRSQRSMSVSSSGCSSSMDDRHCDFSPLYSGNSCRCTSLSMSDFDDDGFREDGSMSSVYTVFSSPRSYHPHHQLHHNHQNVPHHPNNTKGLFDIALKTVKLIRRNQELQMRLAQLQEETKAFIASVMANPENESLRNHIHPGGAIRTTPAPGVVVQK